MSSFGWKYFNVFPRCLDKYQSLEHGWQGSVWSVLTVSPTSSLHSALQSYSHFPMSSNTAQPFTRAVSCLWVHHKSPTSQIVLISTQSSDLSSGATFSHFPGFCHILSQSHCSLYDLSLLQFNIYSWHYLINFCLHFQAIPLSTQPFCT